MAEKRRLRRRRLDLPVHIKLLNEKNVFVSDVETSGRLHDFSAGGCAFYYRQKIPVGKRLQLRIELNEELAKKYSQQELTVRGEVCRINPEGEGFLLSVLFSFDR